MNIKDKAMLQQHELFARLENELKEEQIAAFVRDTSETALSRVLTVAFDEVGSDLDEVLGEYTFLPIADVEDGNDPEDGVRYFESVLTFTEELPKDNLPALYEAVAKLNFYLPQGAIAVDTDSDRLGYKFGAPLPLNLSDEELYSYVNLYITSGYMIADQYIAMLMGIAEGRITVDELMESL